MQLKVRRKVFKVVIVGNLIANWRLEKNTRLVRPTPSDISDCVSTASQNEKRDPKTLDEFDAFCVALEETDVPRVSLSTVPVTRPSLDAPSVSN